MQRRHALAGPSWRPWHHVLHPSPPGQGAGRGLPGSRTHSSAPLSSYSYTELTSSPHSQHPNRAKGKGGTGVSPGASSAWGGQEGAPVGQRDGYRDGHRHERSLPPSEPSERPGAGTDRGWRQLWSFPHCQEVTSCGTEQGRNLRHHPALRHHGKGWEQQRPPTWESSNPNTEIKLMSIISTARKRAVCSSSQGNVSLANTHLFHGKSAKQPKM